MPSIEEMWSVITNEILTEGEKRRGMVNLLEKARIQDTKQDFKWEMETLARIHIDNLYVYDKLCALVFGLMGVCECLAKYAPEEMQERTKQLRIDKINPVLKEAMAINKNLSATISHHEEVLFDEYKKDNGIFNR